ncbi:ankyrin repeat and SOCS box protein 1-like [Ptychodera flava]|uniref:ankyrin repeat and SOCS box protein 1-like n=1 Tax=Ptychodera flava TaxID=63121 RepID=UPI00396A60CD
MSNSRRKSKQSMATYTTVYEDECQWPIHTRDSFLHQAAYVGHIRKVQEYLRDKKNLKNINSKNRLGCTPLRLAATKGHVNCIECLLNHGASVDIADMKAQTPLFMAVQNAHTECVKVLLEAGADPNGNSDHLCSPLYMAVMIGALECLQELVKYGADVNFSQITTSSFSSTPLYISFVYRRLDCFKWLLRSGADPNAGMSGCIPHPSVITPSLFNAAVKRRNKVWIDILVEFDTDLDLNDENLRQLYNHHENEAEFMEYLQSLIYTPRSLQSQARIVIRRCMVNHLNEIDKLPLPSGLKNYVQHQENNNVQID